MVNWKEHFDRIFCLSLADNTERRKEAITDFGRVGIMDSGIFEWKITVRNQLYKYIWTNPNFNSPKWWLNNNGALNCTLGHYEIILQSYVLGYDRVLILEDDCRFHKDLNVLDTIFSNIPEYDICLFDKFSPLNKTSILNAIKNNKVNDYYFDFSRAKLWSCACYALSRNAMRYIIDSQEKCFLPADEITNAIDNYGRVTTNDNLKRVASIQNAAVQEHFGKVYTSETIRNIDKIIYTDLADRKDFNVIL